MWEVPLQHVMGLSPVTRGDIRRLLDGHLADLDRIRGKYPQIIVVNNEDLLGMISKFQAKQIFN